MLSGLGFIELIAHYETDIYDANKRGLRYKAPSTQSTLEGKVNKKNHCLLDFTYSVAFQELPQRLPSRHEKSKVV
jgi:hypothetical protein